MIGGRRVRAAAAVARGPSASAGGTSAGGDPLKSTHGDKL